MARGGHTVSSFKLYKRAFHPDENFGLGGFGFEGDHRGFSVEEAGPTSRIWSRTIVDAQRPNHNYKLADLGGEGEFEVHSDPSQAPGWLGARIEDYLTEETRPKGTARVRGGPYTPDGLQSFTVNIHTWGQNHAFPTEYIADTYRALGYTQEGLSEHGVDINAHSQLLIPELDTKVSVLFSFDRHERVLMIASTLKGDGFPNCEVFVVDEAGTAIMLNTHHRIGSASGQLWGDHGHLLAASVVRIAIDEHDSFIGPIDASRCVDFMPFPFDMIADGQTDFSMSQWNKLHTFREATVRDAFGGDTDDNLFSHEVPRRPLNIPRLPGRTVTPEAPVRVIDLPRWNH